MPRYILREPGNRDLISLCRMNKKVWTYNLQLITYNLQPTTYNLQLTICMFKAASQCLNRGLSGFLLNKPAILFKFNCLQTELA